MVAGNAHPPLDGGTVLITGASAGIGRELAMQLAPRARVLILLARRADRIAMRALPLVPRELSRRQAARSATRLRTTADTPDRREDK